MLDDHRARTAAQHLSALAQHQFHPVLAVEVHAQVRPPAHAVVDAEQAAPAHVAARRGPERQRAGIQVGRRRQREDLAGADLAARHPRGQAAPAAVAGVCFQHQRVCQERTRLPQRGFQAQRARRFGGHHVPGDRLGSHRVVQTGALPLTRQRHRLLRQGLLVALLADGQTQLLALRALHVEGESVAVGERRRRRRGAESGAGGVRFHLQGASALKARRARQPGAGHRGEALGGALSAGGRVRQYVLAGQIVTILDEDALPEAAGGEARRLFRHRSQVRQERHRAAAEVGFRLQAGGIQRLEGAVQGEVGAQAVGQTSQIEVFIRVLLKGQRRDAPDGGRRGLLRRRGVHRDRGQEGQEHDWCHPLHATAPFRAWPTSAGAGLVAAVPAGASRLPPSGAALRRTPGAAASPNATGSRNASPPTPAGSRRHPAILVGPVATAAAAGTRGDRPHARPARAGTRGDRLAPPAGTPPLGSARESRPGQVHPRPPPARRVRVRPSHPWYHALVRCLPGETFLGDRAPGVRARRPSCAEPTPGSKGL